MARDEELLAWPQEFGAREAMLYSIARGDHMVKRPRCFIWTYSSFQSQHDDFYLAYSLHGFHQKWGREEHQHQ